jgi:DNA-binding IclR family transcriptional regulator
MADKEQVILDAMKKAGKPLKAGDIAEVVGMSKDEVAKIIATLKKQGKVVSPKTCFYAPAK